MMRDLESRADIEMLLRDFYRQAFADESIGPFFTEVVPLDLATHLPVITDFWESIVFGTPYAKNVMAVHADIHRKEPIRKEHLERWVALFTATVDAHFEGPRATLMRQRARSVATLMDIKLNHPKPGL
ncbi:group III truncated hemoglobin [Flaviaesturariibacter aridisoli]|nr:group III truncated hemoglobin [Flaviaesturariibacter aridisoli]RYZ16371.1 MAG: group III truncated hemoglobin [Chitinophagaceae bacterium]